MTIHPRAFDPWSIGIQLVFKNLADVNWVTFADKAFLLIDFIRVTCDPTRRCGLDKDTLLVRLFYVNIVCTAFKGSRFQVQVDLSWYDFC